MDFIETNKLLSQLQSGFRPHHSCSTAIVKVLDDIRQPFDQGHLTLLCLLDFSKAFDSVNHKLLCNKLANYFGFSESAVRLLKDYLSNRFQKLSLVISSLNSPPSLQACHKDPFLALYYLVCLSTIYLRDAQMPMCMRMQMTFNCISPTE